MVDFARIELEIPPWPPEIEHLRVGAFDDGYRSHMDTCYDGDVVWTVTATAGTTVGFVYADPGIADTACYLREIVVDPTCRQQGIGRRLVAHLVEWMAELGMETMYVYPLDDEDATRRIAFFEQLGFAEPDDGETTHCADVRTLADRLAHLR